MLDFFLCKVGTRTLVRPQKLLASFSWEALQSKDPKGEWQNEDQGIFYLESQKNVSLGNKNNFFQEINNLQKSYFTIDTELWPNRFNLTRVFSMFLRIPINDKSESESPLTNFYKIGKKHKYWGAYTIRYPDKELDVFLKRLGDGFK